MLGGHGGGWRVELGVERGGWLVVGGAWRMARARQIARMRPESKSPREV